MLKVRNWSGPTRNKYFRPHSKMKMYQADVVEVVVDPSSNSDTDQSELVEQTDEEDEIESDCDSSRRDD